MPIVTLTTDFGTQDYYLATVKGAILCKNEHINIVDITHHIKTYDIVQAAFIVKNCWHAFPKGSIHLVSVNDLYRPEPSFIAIRHQGHFFIGPDNGLFSLVFDEISDHDVYFLQVNGKKTFHLKDIYAEAIAHLSFGKPFQEIGLPYWPIEQRITLQPVISHSQIRGSVIYIDNYDNAIVNITQDLFKKVGNGRNFELYFKRFDPIKSLSRFYGDVPIGETLCLFNSVGYLEISINMGKAAGLLGLKVEDTVQIDFLNSYD